MRPALDALERLLAAADEAAVPEHLLDEPPGVAKTECPHRWLSPAQAAIELGRSVSTVRRWLRDGAPAARPGEVGKRS